MNTAYSSKELTIALERMQALARLMMSRHAKTKQSLEIAIDALDDALEDALAREKHEQENAPECEHFYRFSPSLGTVCEDCGQLYQEPETDADAPEGPSKIDHYAGSGAAR